ncbi:autotransporter domain-containing protein [Prosthecobacter sp.]|uniref:autotransporter domain-containing protein n=1 Tax=Prosthecobacter sp. TaxID=1965333 RepID=UPI00378448E8
MTSRSHAPAFLRSFTAAALLSTAAFLASLRAAPAQSVSVEPYPAGTPIASWLTSDGPGTQVAIFTVPDQNYLLNSITLSMGNASSTLGSFEVSLRTLTTNLDGSLSLNLVQNLTGSANPATAGDYTYTGSTPMAANSQFVVVAQVQSGGGAYTWLTGGTGSHVYVIANGLAGPNLPGPLDLSSVVFFNAGGAGPLISWDATPIDVNGGLQLALGEGQALFGGSQTVLNDVNNHLFSLRSGDGAEDGDGDGDGSLASSMDDGVVMGQGDGPESPAFRRVRRSRPWQAFTTVNYGNLRLSPIGAQAGVQVDSWAPGVGLQRRLSRGLTLGFSVSFLSSRQNYTGGLGSVTLEGPALSAYAAYARKNFWGSLLYSFGDYDLDSSRNPGGGLPFAKGSTTAYTNAVQFNTGWNLRFLNNTLITGPFAGIDYLHGSIQGYSESGAGLAALSYSRQTFQSLVTRVGWSATKKIHTDWADITPQVRLSYERQNLTNNGTSVQAINAPFAATRGSQSPGQDYMVIGTGVNFQFTPAFSLMLGYQTQIFRNNLQAHFGSVRLGYRF